MRTLAPVPRTYVSRDDGVPLPRWGPRVFSARNLPVSSRAAPDEQDKRESVSRL